MRKLRKLALVVVTLAFILNTICVPAMAATFTDVEDSTHEQDINLLYDLGIVNGKTETEFEPEATLTRAEYTTILLRILGLEGTAGGNSSFIDVPESHWAHASINLAYDLGYVNGVGNSMFAPDSPIKVPEVIKMMVCALGWELKAESEGGYPNGYIATAMELDILDGVSVTANGEITRGEMATLVANSLEVEMYSHPLYDYGVNEDKTLLDYMDVTKYEGQITANHMTTISDLSEITEKGKVAMGSLLFDCGDTNASMLLGRKVVIYAKDSNIIDGTILSVQPTRLSEQLIVQASEVQSDTTVDKFIYRDAMTRKKNSVAIKTGAKLVRNGVEVDPWGESDLKPEYGSVTLIMNDGRNADVIIVNKYKNYLVNAVDTEDSTIYLMQNEFDKARLVLDANRSSVSFEIIDYDGTPINLKDLRKWDVLSVSESDDGKTVHIIRTALKIDGRITAISGATLYIDDIDYEVYNHINEVPELGDEGSFYLDYYGNIAHFEKGDVPGEKCGWLVNMVSDGLSQLKMKIFTEDGEMLIYNTTKKITLDDSPCNARNMYNDKSGALFESDAVKPQLIKFRLNSEGNLTEIDTAAGYENDYYNESRLAEFSRDLVITDGEVDGVSVIYSGGSLKSFGSKFLVREKTKIFSIPSTGLDEDYSIIENKSLVHNGPYDDVILYDSDKDNVLTAVVWLREGALMETRPTYDMAAALVIDACYKRDKDDNFKYTLVCVDTKGNEFDLLIDAEFNARAANALTDIYKDEDLWRANERPIELADYVPISVINPGDIIQYEIVDDKVTCINIMFRGETPAEYDHTWSNYPTTGITNATAGSDLYDRGSAYAGYGTVESVSQYAAKVSVKSKDGGETYERAFVMDAVTPMVFDFETNEAKLISYEMIYPGDKILSIRETRYQRFVVVYRNAPEISDAELPPILPGSIVTEPSEGSVKVAVTIEESSGQASSSVPPENAIDGDSATYWQSQRSTEYSDPAYITLDIGAETSLTEIALEFNSATTRTYPFWIEVAGEDGIFMPVLGGDSEEEAIINQPKNELIYYYLGDNISDVRYVRYCGIGNTASGGGSGYVQLKEIQLYGVQPEIPDPEPEPEPEPDPANPIKVTLTSAAITGSGYEAQDGYDELVDGTKEVAAATTNKWQSREYAGDNTVVTTVAEAKAAEAEPIWLQLDLGSEKTVNEIYITFIQGARVYPFWLELLDENGDVVEVITGENDEFLMSSQNATESFSLGNTEGVRYVKLYSVGTRHSRGNKRVQISEVEVYEIPG